MKFVDDIDESLTRDGAVLLTVVFTGADSVPLGEPGQPVRVEHLVITDRAIAYESCAGIRRHAHSILRAVRDGLAWVLIADEGIRLVLERVARSQRTPRTARRPLDGISVRAELQALARSLSRRLRPKAVPASAIAFEAKYHAAWEQGRLRTVGALVRGPGEQLVYTGVTDSDRFIGEHRLWGALSRGFTPDEVFGATEGNGVTVSWSEPFGIVAASVEAAAARLMSRVRFRDCPSEYLRELWLAMDEIRADDVLEEADLVAHPDASGREYLGRIRRAHARLHAEGPPLCRRATRRTRSTREGGGGRDRV